MPEKKYLRLVLKCLYAALGILIVWLLMRFVLPWLMPFILALVISRFIEPAVRFLTGRLCFRRGIAALLCTVLVFSALIGLSAALIERLVFELTAFLDGFPPLLSSAAEFVKMIESRTNGFISSAPPEIQNYLTSALNGIVDKSAALPAELSQKLLGLFPAVAGKMPGLMLFIFTCAISVFFISCDYRGVTGFIMRQVPTPRRAMIRDFKTDLISTLGKWVKAQFILCGITFLELTAAFCFIRLDFAVLLAFVIAVVDALPVLGAGTVMVPWAVIALLGGDTQLAISVMVAFGAVALVRSALEPKLISEKAGIPPLAALAAMYIGYCSIGVAGMVFFPIGLIMLKNLNDRGYIKLWK